MNAPLLFAWNGCAMEPLPSHRRLAHAQFKPGRVYRLHQHADQRNMNAHRLFFAAIAEAWNHLHEQDYDRFRSPDELRRWALTHTAHRDIREYPARTAAEALRVAKYLKEGGRYSRIEIEGNIVREYIPHSQSLQAMGPSTFKASMDAVFLVLAERLGVSVDDLKKNTGGKAA